jgi:hypothetical protein
MCFFNHFVENNLKLHPKTNHHPTLKHRHPLHQPSDQFVIILANHACLDIEKLRPFNNTLALGLAVGIL